MDAADQNGFEVRPGTPEQEADYVRVAGELDILMVRSVTPKLDELLARSPSHVVLDLSGIEFIDSSGIGLLLKIHTQVVKLGGGTMQVASASDAARRTLDLCGLTEAFGLEERP